MEDKLTANESFDDQIKRGRIDRYLLLWGGPPFAFMTTYAALIKTYDVIPLTINYTIQVVMFILLSGMMIWGYRKSTKMYMAFVRELRFRDNTIIIETEKHIFGKSVPVSMCRVRKSEIIIKEGVLSTSRKTDALLLHDGEETFTIVLEFFPEGTKEFILSKLQGK